MNPADTAGYWTPTLHNTSTGAIVPTVAFTACCRGWNGSTAGEGVALPEDTRLVANRYGWTCGQREAIGTDLVLSSDRPAGTTDGRSMHADFWNTWVQAGFVTMVRDCINPGRNRTAAKCG